MSAPPTPPTAHPSQSAPISVLPYGDGTHTNNNHVKIGLDDDDDNNDLYENEIDDENDENDDSALQIDLPALVNELQRISESVDHVFSAIQHSIEYSSRASLILSEFTVVQVEDLAQEARDVNTQVSYLVDLFTTLQMKMVQLMAVLTLLPSYEQELDRIIAQLPYLEKRVEKVAKGLIDGTQRFTPPSMGNQELFARDVEEKYQQVVNSEAGKQRK